MKIAVVSESPADEAAIKILVDAVVGSESDLYSLRTRPYGWTKIFELLPNIINGLHYGTDVEAPTTASADCDRDDRRHVLVRRCHGQAGGCGTVRFLSDRYLLPMYEKLRRLVRRYDHRGRRRIIHEAAAGAHDIGWQRIAGGIEQLRTREAEECTAHIELIREVERAYQITRSCIDALWGERQAGGVAAIARHGRRYDGQPIWIGLPEEALIVSPLLQAERTVDPRLAAVRKRREIIGLAPYQ